MKTLLRALEIRSTTLQNTNALGEVNGIFKANMEQVSLALEFFMDLLTNILNVLTPFIEPLRSLALVFYRLFVAQWKASMAFSAS